MHIPSVLVHIHSNGVLGEVTCQGHSSSSSQFASEGIHTQGFSGLPSDSVAEPPHPDFLALKPNEQLRPPERSVMMEMFYLLYPEG